MHKRRLFPVLASMVAIAVAVHAEEKPVELRLSMPRQTWAEGDDVRLNVELINRMPHHVRLNVGPSIVFVFWSDKGQSSVGVRVSEFFGPSLVLQSGMRIGREVSLPSCPFFDRYFPNSIVSVGHHQGFDSELTSTNGEYAIQATLCLLDAYQVKTSQRSTESLPLSYELESEKITWKMVSPGKIMARETRGPWQVLAIGPDADKKDTDMGTGRQRTKIVYWHLKFYNEKPGTDEI